MTQTRHLGQTIVSALYSHGIRRVWNAIARLLQAPLLPAMSSLPKGGSLPAVDTLGSVPFVLIGTDELPSQGVGESKSPG